jgi:hypothetical protein
MIPRLEYNERVYLNWSEDSLIDAGIPQKVIEWAKLPSDVSKLSLVRAMRYIPFGDSNAWESAAKPTLAAAPQEIQEEWEYATRIPLNHPIVLGLFSQVIPDEEQQRELQLAIFQLASQIDKGDI